MARTDEAILITRRGHPVAVLTRPGDDDGWKETRAVQADRALMKEIRLGLRELEKGGRIYTLEELLPVRSRPRS